MVKVLQYGEGNFLRTFVDVYFDTLNKNGQGRYAVNIVKPITFGTLERFERQENKYHIVLRGMENGRAVENVYKIDSLENVIDPFAEYEKYVALAKDKELKIIVSNTTEAGICFNEQDKMDGFDGITVSKKARIIISRSDKKAKLISMGNEEFFNVLRKKLMSAM